MTSNRTFGAITAGLVTTVLLAVAATGRHPQGNVARATPYVVAAGLVWVAVAGPWPGPVRR